MLYGLIIQSNQNKGKAWWLVGSSKPGPDMFTPRLDPNTLRAHFKFKLSLCVYNALGKG